MKRLDFAVGTRIRGFKQTHRSKYQMALIFEFEAMSDFGLKVPEFINSADEIFSLVNKIDAMEESMRSSA